MAQRAPFCATSRLLSLFSVASWLVACGQSSASKGDGASREAGPAASGGNGAVAGGAGRAGAAAGGTAPRGGAAGVAITDASGADDCNRNRGSGIAINSGTVSTKIDGQTVSGPGTLLWATSSNTMTLDNPDGSALVIIFPGCSAKTYSIPADGAPPEAISITYTGGGGDPQWACTYEDANLGPARCSIDVTAYGLQQNAPVTGTFSGVLRLRRGTGSSTKSVAAGTFTFGRP